MRREFGILFLSAAFGCGGMNVSGHAEPSSVVQQLTVTTDDGKALYGEIDFPFADSAHALVLLVPGTGGYDRNMKFGRSGTADDLIFARLANALTGKGLAVVRYDERGRACTPNLEPGQDGLCADKTLISQVTPERTATDIANVAAAAMRDSKSACLIVIAHS